MKKHALITGASGEIGREIALLMAKTCDLTLVGGSNTSATEQLTDEISSVYKDCRIQSLNGDIKNPSFISDIIAKAHSFSLIDIFIHCAGVSYTGLLQDMSDDAWDDVMSTNLSSCFRFSKALIPDMLENKGRMVFVSSVWGSCGASCEVAYSASKAGMNGFVMALAKELSPSGISVNAISPGFIDTKMNSHLSDSEKSDFIDTIPAGRAGLAREVAEAVSHLLDMPSYMTGQIIRIDGGLV